MATYSSHGGGCCGMKHFHNFRDEPGLNVSELLRLTRHNGMGDDRLQLEVILSDRQTYYNPALIETLARLGFVYTSSWTGQHGTPVHLFLRAKKRLALSAANFYNRWVNDLNGMLPHPALSGPLPRLNEGQAQRLRVGDRVRCILRESLRQGEVGTIHALRDFGEYQVRYDWDGHISTFRSRDSVELINPEPVEPAPATVYRHPTNPAFAEVPVGFPRRLILSQFYCVFRATGQASRVFSTLAEGQEAYPTALDWHERKVYSDGEVVEGPVQHG